MMLTRQRFLSLVAVVVAVHGALAFAIALPVIVDAAGEALHVLLNVCRHPFRAHYLRPVTAVALVVAATALAVTVRFAASCRSLVIRTDADLRPLLALPRAVPSESVRATIDQCGLAGRVDVLDTMAPLAFCHGIIRPRVSVSVGLCQLLNGPELAAVLLHEEFHRRRREPLRIIVLAGTVHALHVWPALFRLLADVRAEMEVAADAHAVRCTGSATPLARALLKVVEHPAYTEPRPDPSLAVSRLTPTDARIDSLWQPAARLYPPLPWAYLGGLAVTGVSITVGLAALAAGSNLHPLLHACGG